MGSDLFEFARAETWIDRNRPGIELADSEQDRAKRNAVFAGDHHPIAGPDLQLAQVVDHRLDRLGKLPVAPGASRFDERRMVRSLPRKPLVNRVHARRQAFEQILNGDVLRNHRHRSLPH